MEDDGSIMEMCQIGGELVVYTDTVTFDNPPRAVEEMGLHWLDGSVDIIQMRRPLGWQPGMPEGMAEEFRSVLQWMLSQLFWGEDSVTLGVNQTDIDGTYFS